MTSALMKGSGMHIITAMTTESGHQAIQDIDTWHGSNAISRTIIDHYQNKIETLMLTEANTASNYINNFLICAEKLEKKKEGYTIETKRHKFLDQIKDDEYNIIK